MRAGLRLLFAVFVLAFGGAAAFAQESDGGSLPNETTSVSELDALVARALGRSPSLAALSLRLKAANERIGTTATLPNPTLEISAQEIGVYRFDKSSSFLLEYRQGLPYPGKREVRRRVSQTEAEIQGLLLEDVRRRVAAEIKTGYAEIYALDAERRSLREAGAILETLAATRAARVAVGQADALQVLRISLETARIKERSLDLEGERAKWLAGLCRLLDEKECELGEVLALPLPPNVDETVPEAAVKNAAELALGKAYERLSESRVREAVLDQKPDFMLGVGAGIDGMPQPMLMLRFGLELPVWSAGRQEPLLRASGFERQAARQDLSEAEARIRTEARRLYGHWRRDEALLARYREDLSPKSQAALDAAQASYLAGKGDFRDVAEMLGLWLQTRAQAVRREAERFKTWAALEALSSPLAARATKGATP